MPTTVLGVQSPNVVEDLRSIGDQLEEQIDIAGELGLLPLALTNEDADQPEGSFPAIVADRWYGSGKP